MKVLPAGPKDGYHTYLKITGVLVNRWTLARALKKMPGVKILNAQITRNFFRGRPLITFEYKSRKFIVEPESFAGNELEISEIQSRYTNELFEIQEYLSKL